MVRKSILKNGSSIQYRMHPDISHLPSQVFYDGKLLDGPDMAEKTRRPWHTHSNFGPYKFYNVQSGLEEQSGHSIRNTAECSVAVSLYEQLRREFPSVDLDFRIGVVSMYKAQVKALRQLFTERFGKTILTTIDFNTVDGFQGQEKDIIILSCVRAGPGLQTVGFLSGPSYHILYLVGDPDNLRRCSANERGFNTSKVFALHSWSRPDIGAK